MTLLYGVQGIANIETPQDLVIEEGDFVLFQVGLRPADVIIKDLNNDGLPDVATVSIGIGVSVLLRQ